MVAAFTRKAVKAIVNRLGYDIRRLVDSPALECGRYDVIHHFGDQFMKLLSGHRVDLVLDVGANEGWYAIGLRELGFQGKIVSFEPLSTAHGRMVEAWRKESNSNWIIADRMAIGDCNADVSINVSANSDSSSLLPILPEHLKACPESNYIGSEMVPMRKLADVARHYVEESSSPFLKIDVQGFEKKVLQGAESMVASIAGVQIELSLVPLYEGQELYLDMLHLMKDLGFSLFSITPGFTDSQTGRLLSIDGIFFREYLLER